MPRVRILSKGFIPFIGKNGPIYNPVTITEGELTMLNGMGIKVQVLRKDTRELLASNTVMRGETIKLVAHQNEPITNIIEEPAPIIETVPPVVLEEAPIVEEVAVIEEPVVEEIPVVAPVEEVVTEEEPIVDEESQEFEETDGTDIDVNDEGLSANAYYEEEWLTKAKAITILTNREIEFNNNDTAANLKALVMSSNPEVEFTE